MAVLACSGRNRMTRYMSAFLKNWTRAIRLILGDGDLSKLVTDSGMSTCMVGRPEAMGSV
eukprot:349878-Chlamydomonas_euryale.AAC.4